MVISDTCIDLRFQLSMPASGRTIQVAPPFTGVRVHLLLYLCFPLGCGLMAGVGQGGRMAMLLFDKLPTALEATLLYSKHDAPSLLRHVHSVEDQAALSSQVDRHFCHLNALAFCMFNFLLFHVSVPRTSCFILCLSPITCHRLSFCS